MKERANKFLKNLDFFLGIPVVFFLGIIKKILLKKKPVSIEKTNISRIGILKEAAIGDLTILTGILKDLEIAFPMAKIILFCSKSNYELTRLFDLKGQIEVVVLPMTNIFKTIEMVMGVDEMDILFDFGQWPRINSVISFFANAKIKVGFQTDKQYRHYVYDVVVIHSNKRHEIENFRELLKVMGIKSGSMPSLRVEDCELKLPEKFVVFHMFPGGSRAHLKKWNVNNWVVLGKYLIEKGYCIILSGGKDNYKDAEVVRWKFEHEGIDGNKIINFAGEKLINTVYALTKSSLVISIDTAIVHIASALNIKLIALYGPTSPERWGPLSKNSRAISSTADCGPCISLGFESKCEKNKCMDLIKPSKVIEIIDSLL
ncbi:MAG: glycosyltransferase family 9 protein [Brevinematia bacterium]